MRFLRVSLNAPSDLPDFYSRQLGIDLSQPVGETTLEFVPAAGQPFYHFAFLVPGDRFDAALEWARERTDLLADETGEIVFDFDNWDATACYFLDPAGNIVELAAHRGIDENDRDGDFSSAEFAGLSELGLVGDKKAMAAELATVGLQMWNGSLEEPERLAFVGERGRTFILAPPGRNWFPTGRAAEIHPVEAVFAEGSAMLDGGALVINATSA